MCLLAVDLGGTKLALAVFNKHGDLLREEKVLLDQRSGKEVGALVVEHIERFICVQKDTEAPTSSIGISIPGIYHRSEGTVWVPNIAGWSNYPLLKEVQTIAGDISVSIDSDRSCYILGEWWKGAAKDCANVIFLAVGTGIGAGILVDGKILRGANDIAGATGWMALQRPFSTDYIECGCFESTASGSGIAKLAKKTLLEKEGYEGVLKSKLQTLTATDVFEAFEEGDTVATEVVQHCIETWGMAIANLVSLFNPEKIILGGGVFGPAVKFIPAIYEEAAKWAQPISIKQVSIEPAALGSRAGLYGAAYLALQNNKTLSMHE
ncbi:MAG: ROK family protein [Flavisolibacter sp.]